ncbi:cytidine deaminase [Companilactobacillus musae]|uniref:cytidine deaminase family protein n=1 Tax=Companilactobacillus musae TaxID=1903258 RepID=UPI000E64D694|nr:cytidine deaminase [Companilactobacillus musae]
MSTSWTELYDAAYKVLKPRDVSRIIEAGGVAAAVESDTGKIYVGVCVDSACTLGICAERNAIFNMITNGEDRIKRVIAVSSNGKAIPPCGACREFMTQLMPDDYHKIQIMLDYQNNRVVNLAKLTPEWWI